MKIIPTPLEDVTWMLLGVSDTAAFAAGKELIAAPGARCSYSSGDSALLSKLIRERLGEKDYPRRLFDPVGMERAVIETDAAGTFVGSSYMYPTAQGLGEAGAALSAKRCLGGPAHPA